MSLKNSLLTTLVFFSAGVFAQSTFSLKEAINYALDNHSNYQNSIIDAQIALAKKNEITGIGLLQLNGSFDLRYNPKVPTQVLPNFIGPAILQTLQGVGMLPAGPLPKAEPEFIAAQFGVKYNASTGINAGQLLFSSDYIVGLQAARAVLELSKKKIERNKIDVIAAVSKAYYGVVINKERIKLIEANVKRLQKLRDDTRALYHNGFVEKIDLDRVDLALNNLMIEKEKIVRLFDLAKSLLKFQMGYDINSPIVLTDILAFLEADFSLLNDKFGTRD